MQFHHGTTVGRVGAITGVHHAEVINPRGQPWKQLADPQTTLTVLPESPRRPQQVLGRIELDPWLCEWKRLTVITIEQRLPVKGIDLRRSAGHQQEDDPFGPCRYQGTPGRQRSASLPVTRQESVQGQRAKPDGCSLQHSSSRRVFVHRPAFRIGSILNSLPHIDGSPQVHELVGGEHDMTQPGPGRQRQFRLVH